MFDFSLELLPCMKIAIFFDMIKMRMLSNLLL